MYSNLFAANRLNWKLFIPIILLIVSCSGKVDVEVKKISRPNPTSDVFALPDNKLHDTLLELFNVHSQMDDPILISVFVARHKLGPRESDNVQVIFEPETMSNAYIGRDYFKSKETSNDIYLQSQGEYWTSKVYFVKQTPLPFRAEYSIHIIPLDSSHSKIVVTAQHPFIRSNDKEMGVAALHAETMPAQSTTIEEYCLILYIATKLGKQNEAIVMPEVK